MVKACGKVRIMKKLLKTMLMVLGLCLMAGLTGNWGDGFVAKADDAPYVLVFDGNEYVPSSYYSTEYNVLPGESLSLPFSVTGKNKSKVSVYLSERYVVADEDKSVATIKKGVLSITGINYKTSYDLVADDGEGNKTYIDIYVSCSSIKASTKGLGGLFSGMIAVTSGKSTKIEIDVTSPDMDGVEYYGYYQKKDLSSVSLGNGERIPVNDGKIVLTTEKITQAYEYYLVVEDTHGNYTESKLLLDTIAVNPLPNKKIYDKYRTYYIDLAKGEKTTVEIAIAPENKQYGIKWYNNFAEVKGENGTSLTITGDGSGWDSYIDAEVTELSSGKTVKCSFTVRNLTKEYVEEGNELSLTVANSEETPDITVTGIEDGGLYSGDVEFTVSCPEACMVLATTDGESYTRLAANKTDDKNTYSFGFEMREGLQIIIVKIGDVDMDGWVNSVDAMEILKYDVMKADFGVLELCIADVVIDNAADSLDAMEILKKDVKKTVIAW